MKAVLEKIKTALEHLDGLRDKVLFVFIKPYWPRSITPNHLTFFRIVIGIFLFILLFYYKSTSQLLIISLFCIGAFTDMLDGSIARGLDKETKTGIIFDPIADRINSFCCSFGHWLFGNISFYEFKIRIQKKIPGCFLLCQ